MRPLPLKKRLPVGQRIQIDLALQPVPLLFAGVGEEQVAAVVENVDFAGFGEAGFWKDGAQDGGIHGDAQRATGCWAEFLMVCTIYISEERMLPLLGKDSSRLRSVGHSTTVALLYTPRSRLSHCEKSPEKRLL